MNRFRFDYSKEEQMAPFTMLGSQKQLFLVVLHAGVMCRQGIRKYSDVMSMLSRYKILVAAVLLPDLCKRFLE